MWEGCSKINNNGVYFYIISKGGAITVTGQLISAGSIRQLYNPQCFLQYQDPRAPPPTWNVRPGLFPNPYVFFLIYPVHMHDCRL